jgi:hypothetical protein
MLKPNKISFPFPKFFALGLLCCWFGSLEVLAQEERGRVISDPHPGTDQVDENVEMHGDISESKSVKTPNQSVTTTPQNEIKNEQLYKQRGEKEVKNEGLSTLSFNLFLYVADKFKEKI